MAVEWNTSLFGCAEDKDICLLTCFCPCIQIGRNIEVLTEKKPEFSTGCCGYFTLDALTGLGFFLTCAYRKKLREKFGLRGSVLNDFFVHCLFPSCAICQEGRELKSRGMDPALGYKAAASKLDEAPEKQQMV